MPRKLTQEEAVLIIQEKCKEKNYKCGEFGYIGVHKTRLSMVCGDCGCEWNPSYSSFINQNKGCPDCGIKLRNSKLTTTQEEAVLIVQEKCKEKNYKCGEFDYTGNKTTRLQIVCGVCGYKWNPSYNDFINLNSGCPDCSGTRKLTQEEAVLRVQEKCKEKNYKCGEFGYIGALKTKLPIKCGSCGYKWNPSYSSFINLNTGCPDCGIKSRVEKQTKTQEEAVLRVKEKCKEKNYKCGEFDYTGIMKTRLSIKCEICGCKWNPSYHNFINSNSGCPDCSKGESKNLIDIDLLLPIVQKEKRFMDCKNKRTLPFDRYVQELNLLLEYDGEQHFKINEHWGGLNAFCQLIKNDKIKTEYAIKNGYNFLRIAYYEDHIKVLQDFLKLIEDNPTKQVVQIYGKIQILNKNNVKGLT